MTIVATTIKEKLTPQVCASLLCVLIAALVVAYMYFLSMSVVHVVFRKEINQDMRSLESEISALESTYIEAQHKVSERIASAKTLAETNDKIFVKRSVSAVALSRQDN